MEPTPPNQLFLVAVLLLSSVICTFSVKQCPNCGLTSVPYPLSTNPTCGDQSYKIRCNAGVLIFDTLNNSYPINFINPSNQRLVIQPANLLPNTCISSDFIHQGIQLSSSLPFNITGENTVMLFNCSESILDQPLNCSPSSLCHLYVEGEEYSRCRDSSLCCTFKAGGSASAYRIRVLENGCRAYRSFIGLDWGLPVDKWPNPGVEIQWVLPLEPVCESQVDCDANSTCELNRSDGVRRCHCKVGLQWNPIQGNCTQTGGCQSPGGCDRQTKKTLITALTSSLSALVLLITIAILLHKRYKRIKEAQKRLARHCEEILSVDGSKSAKHFTSKDIKKATKNFSKDCLIGVGGYGEVYKGYLEDGTVVAVKCAKIIDYLL
ncbi:hypothetical protein GH714_036279 [Hevea brasiliensis]|uniref:Wall-associated receptor kinase galacturonan-binding domain-containing protein n=1 Tax=Hevea brasiliensis TaxID=3981 RepID=A0A6A6L421_HEVBR|nr:hypothetical protein GH714_036234 [Hevea brasiliensis]KAF2296130.1 hypothetical protein GH714_036279 [Hevea brasiliensis]